MLKDGAVSAFSNEYWRKYERIVFCKFAGLVCIGN